MLTLIAEDEDEDFAARMTTKQSTTVWINRPRYILEQQDENYFCWKHDFGNPANSVPVWLMNSWRNTSHGTGVFIPCTRKGNKPNMPISLIFMVEDGK
ncbi:hypothetical protein L1987_38846 [Smallanthus sonchifolius]|uniref:Uncharacterized protein n=1 Tax=Smallanthus sonchifolius TaxID=185202 RepID=A0ACB9HLP8_9ASTR|nr:hypothetical protein L1987_38846 [Smallanthus sonchifolius]